jgi:signal peptidase I
LGSPTPVPPTSVPPRDFVGTGLASVVVQSTGPQLALQSVLVTDQTGFTESSADAKNGSMNGSSRHRKRRATSRTTRLLTEYAVLIVSALILASLIRAFLGLAFWIPTKSMDPTLQVGERVVVSRLSYRMHPPNRGDIVVFLNPSWEEPPKPILPIRLVKGLGEFVGIGQPEEKNYIKRIIGLPGDTVEGKDGKVFINGKPLDEPYLQPDITTSDFEAKKVPVGTYWMMGDNRPESSDSRFFTDSKGDPAPFIPLEKIVGRAFVRVWPVTRMGAP